MLKIQESPLPSMPWLIELDYMIEDLLSETGVHIVRHSRLNN